MNEIASYVAGWIAAQGIEIVVLDGANRFDPYAVSFFARRRWISPETLLKKIRIARAFTCYQMSALMGEKLAAFLKGEAVRQGLKPKVILLGPLTTFLDEDVSEREVSPLLERSLKKVDALAAEGVSFLLFQSLIPPPFKEDVSHEETLPVFSSGLEDISGRRRSQGDDGKRTGTKNH